MKIRTSDKVRIARERAGVTQASAASEVGLSLHQYRMRETGEGKDWRLSELESAAKLFGVELFELSSS